MKQSELRKHAECSLCGRKVMACGLPLFYRVTIERFGIDMRAVQRQAGLEMLLGSPSIAAAMGPDEDMTMPMMEPAVLTVCEDCSTARDLPVAALAERAPAAAQQESPPLAAEKEKQG